ncbi:unnamed protein product [Gongylonema pulchrum]|uniref:Uncharacterized protein n=1 Tax=Gongylonema pulchrum TaxID=637853 RepID=A0A3P6QH54_9BILA|nr:unnamed protein product [Gongylonema pulchrum]
MDSIPSYQVSHSLLSLSNWCMCMYTFIGVTFSLNGWMGVRLDKNPAAA